jgi:hypothetical protein
VPVPGEHLDLGIGVTRRVGTISDAENARRIAREEAAARVPYDGEPYRVSANRTLEDATREWVDAVRGATDEASLVQATKQLMASTRGYFAWNGQDRSLESIRTTSVRQLVYLIEHAPVSDAAASLIYREIAKLGDLKRLDDVEVDGRRAVRIQFAAISEKGVAPPVARGLEADTLLEIERTKRPSVLVIDAESGRIVRLESVDRHLRRELGRTSWEARIGAGVFWCDGIVPNLPCSLERGTHPAALEADRRAASPHARDMARGMAAADNSSPRKQIDARGRRVPVLPWSPDLPEGAF